VTRHDIYTWLDGWMRGVVGQEGRMCMAWHGICAR
jgi:hypothetical protein